MTSKAAESATGVAARPGGVQDVSTPMAMGWGAGALCTSASINFVGFLVLPFMTSRMGMAAALAGGLISITKLVSLAFDPLVGVLSDRTRTPIGRRRPYILLGSLLLPASLVMLFSPPAGLRLGQAPVYYAAGLLLFGAAYAVFRVPYLTMSAEMTSDAKTRTRMISFKIAAISVGSLISTAGLPALIDALGSDRASYGKAAGVMAACAFAAGLYCFFATRLGRFTLRPHLPGHFVGRMRSLLGNAPLAALIGAKAVFYSGYAFQVSCAAYFVLYVMHRTLSVLAIYFAVLTIDAVASQPLWLWFSRRWGKRMTFVVATLVIVLSDFGWLAVGADRSIASVVIEALVIGAAGGGVSLATESMLPDLMALDTRRTGLNREGAFAALFSLSEKLTTAVSLALLGLMLQASGFIASTRDVAQPASATQAISAAMSLIPAAGALASAVLVYLWGLRDEASARPRASDQIGTVPGS